MQLKDFLFQHKQSRKIAVKHQNTSLSYSDLCSDVEKNVHILKQSRISSQNIGIFLPNSLDYVTSYFTIASLDRVIVPIAVNSKKAEIVSTVNYCELRLIITNATYKNVLGDALKELDSSIVLYDISSHGFISVGATEGALLDSPIPNESGEDSTILMLHTSGTTSNPKRVMLTHKNLLSNVKAIIASQKLTTDDKTLIVLPMYLASGNTSQLLAHICLGASIVIMDGLFMPTNFFRLIQEEKITNATGVPSILLTLLSFGNRSNYDLSSLRFFCLCGGFTPVEKIKGFMDTFPSVTLIHGYGQTEATTRVTHLLPEDRYRKTGSVGKPIPGVEVRIINEKGEDAKPGETGEIIVRGLNVMKGYYKRPEETSKALRNEWLHTGDIAEFDAEGYIYMKGRMKNIIISGGINIYPEEIEELLLLHPAVKEVCVTGEEDDALVEVPVAKVVLKEQPSPVSEDHLINYCAQNLSSYKIPRKVYFVDELPKTASGKIKRFTNN